jgi:hypothetical protein
MTSGKINWKEAVMEKVLFRHLPGGTEEIIQLICILYSLRNDDFIINSI